MLTIGALMLLSTLMLRVNTNNLTTDSIRAEAQYGVLATSIITSIMEEAKSLAFDESTTANSITNLDDLTSVSKLGPESGETFDTFNDFDDFDGYTRVDSTMPSAIFNIGCTIDYVNSSNLLGTSSLSTWHKRITVTVSSDYMTDTLTQSNIYSYWFFR